MSRTGVIHAAAWVLWLIAVVIALSITRNPLYVGIVLLWIAVVDLSVRTLLPPTSAPFSAWRFGLTVVPLAALINGLSVHIGTTILFVLPRTLPLIGGPMTLEAVLYGALNGLVLVGLLAAVLLIGRVLTVHELVGLIPRAYYPVAVVVTIALTFVPLTRQQWQLIREAQAVRGHQVRGLRDWVPLFLPLLLSGLERALQLAEAMTARGFAGLAGETYAGQDRVGLLIGLSGVVAGLWLQLLGQRGSLGMIFTLVGVGFVVGTLWLIGRRAARTVYRPAPFRRRDLAVAGSAVVMALLFLLPWPGLERTSLFFYPYPTLTLPSFALPLGLATWGLLTPALVLFANHLKQPTHD